VEAQALRVALPARLSAPNLPELNYSQVSAVQAVLQAPLSLIQGALHASNVRSSMRTVAHTSQLLSQQSPSWVSHCSRLQTCHVYAA